jgi:hypothetical protein
MRNLILPALIALSAGCAPVVYVPRRPVAYVAPPIVYARPVRPVYVPRPPAVYVRPPRVRVWW